MSAKLRSLIATYCTSLPSNVAAVERSLAPPPGSTDAILSNLADALRRLHRIKGAGGSLGFADVSHAAADLETRLKALNGAAMGDGARLAPVLESLGQLKQLASSIKPEGSALYDVDLSVFAPKPRVRNRV